uniref:phosphopantetheine-binding protein n=1 Tax=Nocardia farcinica TaxID=37329 RepID=UPI00245745AE
HALRATLAASAAHPPRKVPELRVLPPQQPPRLRAPPAPRETAGAGAVSGGSAETERTLIQLLEELLDITDVEPEDNFFALGGDSVISIQWSARAAALGLALTPQLVFEHMTIAELAAAVDAAGPVDAQAESTAAPQPESAPMSASGLDSDALAALTASWQAQS